MRVIGRFRFIVANAKAAVFRQLVHIVHGETLLATYGIVFPSVHAQQEF
jgi:hypothetical protein